MSTKSTTPTATLNEPRICHRGNAKVTTGHTVHAKSPHLKYTYEEYQVEEHKNELDKLGTAVEARLTTSTSSSHFSSFLGRFLVGFIEL
jgi:hypothetical protein